MSAEDHYIDDLERDNRRLTSLVADLRAELAEEKKISAAWCVQAQEAEEALAKRESVAEIDVDADLDGHAHQYAEGWNDCRRAMLAASQQAREEGK